MPYRNDIVFQQQAIARLLTVTTLGTKPKILLKAPTGSGKTFILSSYVAEYLAQTDEPTAFIWLTPGKGNLEEQSERKMRAYFPQLRTKFISDVLTDGFAAGDVAFINWEVVSNENNIALRDREHQSLQQQVAAAEHLVFIVIVDEEHYNKTYQASTVLSLFAPRYLIGASATTKPDPAAELIEIDEMDVIREGMITRILSINEGISSGMVTDDQLCLLDLALDKQRQIADEYRRRDIAVNPLIIVQVPNRSDELVEAVERHLAAKDLTYENRALSKWLADDKNKINLEQIEASYAQPIVIIIKQAVATGWDCPRAKILVKLRDNMSETFEIQTIGRIRRMPESKHYGCDLLDNSYLYTFDSKYTDDVRQSLGDRAVCTRLIFLKPAYQSFSIKKEQRAQSSTLLGERETLHVIRQHFADKYSLTADDAHNRLQLQAAGYDFNPNIVSQTIQGETVKTDRTSFLHMDSIRVESVVSTHAHGRALHHAIGEISQRAGISAGVGMRAQYQLVRNILERLFCGRSHSFLSLTGSAFYAFVINNTAALKSDFKDALVATEPQTSLDDRHIREEDFSFPRECLLPYDPDLRDVEVYENSVYQDYTSDAVRSLPESRFEAFCSENPNVTWFYKNGESSQDYFSIVYTDRTGKAWLFYPDYLLCLRDGTIWIIETKGGETAAGEDKNIDRDAPSKFQALRRYASQHGYSYGFVRDDRRGKLYINRGERYVDSMSDPAWELLKRVIPN